MHTNLQCVKKLRSAGFEFYQEVSFLY
jgi:hypothetical protein